MENILENMLLLVVDFVSSDTGEGEGDVEGLIAAAAAAARGRGMADNKLTIVHGQTCYK